MDDTKLLTITVRPGWKKGTKVTFPGEGDEGVGVLAPDIIFVVEEKAEAGSGYAREGNNLVYTYKLSLSDALTDCSLQIPTLDSRIISIACPEVVSPYYEKTIPGLLFLMLFFFSSFFYVKIQERVCQFQSGREREAI